MNTCFSKSWRWTCMTRMFVFSMAMLVPVSYVSCKQRLDSSRLKDESPREFGRCVALRGNGTHIVSHMTGLAKITSEWGAIDGISGGSSATISTFIYESILLNPSVKDLDGAARKEAIALLLKSLIGFADEVSTEPEWRAVQSAGVIGKKLIDRDIFKIPPSDVTKLADALRAAFGSEDIKNLINPEIIRMLDPSADNTTYGGFKNRVLEVRKAALSLTDLDASDPDVFFRQGIINFPYFVSMIGRVGDFYAGRGVNRPDFSAFLRDCAPGSSGALWRAVSQRESENGSCGTRFSQLVHQWRSVYQNKESSRLRESPGLGMMSIMITSVVNDAEGLSALKSYDQQYLAGQSRKLELPFSNVKFGYWISQGLPENLIHSWRNSSTDAKAEKSVGLGYANSWREILEKSPREPSLGKFVEFSSGESASGAVSLGGWADLHPVQVLRFAGCKEIIYLTRRTGETTFITKGPPFAGRARSGLAEMLGMTEAEYNRIYNLDQQSSAYSTALREADGVWCTDWNKFSAAEQAGIALDGWNAPLVTKHKPFYAWKQVDHSGVKIQGCN